MKRGGKEVKREANKAKELRKGECTSTWHGIISKETV